MKRSKMRKTEDTGNKIMIREILGKRKRETQRKIF